MNKYKINTIISLVTACIFILLCSIRLDAQGIYASEIYQALGSFAYLGIENPVTSSLSFNNIPIMNMSYLGAIKTGIYGLYMRIFSQPFNIISWRICGIGFVSVTLFIFVLLLRQSLSFAGLFSFLVLFFTDITVLLFTRHDWGPTALALSLRLILIALFVQSEITNRVTKKNTFILGFLVGLSIYEKLSSTVLIIPLGLMIFSSQKRRNSEHILSGFSGGIVGAIPLIFANYYSYIIQGNFYSLQFDPKFQGIYVNSLMEYLLEFISLGAGGGARFFILGLDSNTMVNFELFLFPLVLIILLYLLIKHQFAPVKFRLSGILLACYLSIMVLIRLLPQNTWVHHYIIGTPFQYMAIALFFSDEVVSLKDIKKLSSRTIFTLVLGILAITRLYGLMNLEYALAQGKTSPTWDKSLTQISEFAAKNSEVAFFTAPDWGVTNQIVCYLNGDKDGAVLQPNWDIDPGAQIYLEINDSPKNELYLIFQDPPYYITPERKRAIIEDINNYLFPDWRIVLENPEVLDYRALDIIKFRKFSSQ